MTDPVEELIREIAAKHGIAVSRDDPILILQTINTRLLQDSAKAQQVMLDQYKEELEALALRWGNDARDQGGEDPECVAGGEQGGDGEADAGGCEGSGGFGAWRNRRGAGAGRRRDG
jgi:hypothetical protein